MEGVQQRILTVKKRLRRFSNFVRRALEWERMIPLGRFKMGG